MNDCKVKAIVATFSGNGHLDSAGGGGLRKQESLVCLGQLKEGMSDDPLGPVWLM